MTTAVTKYRNAIMGVSILCIVVYHSALVLPNFLNPIKSYGYAGVDVFLLLSGFGLYQAWDRNPDCLKFYKRRLKRILPAYLPVFVIWILLEMFQGSLGFSSLPKIIIGNLTGLSFWALLTPRFNWYMMALFSFYLMAPIFAMIIKEYDKAGERCLLLFIVLVNFCLLGCYHMIAISRFVIFALGMIMGKRHITEQQISEETEILTYLSAVFAGIVLVFFRQNPTDLLWNYGLYWYPFIIIGPAIIFCLCRLFAFAERSFVGQKILHVLNLCGAASLEIYLIHILIFEEYRLQLSSNGLWLLACVAVTFLGCVYHLMVNKGMALLRINK